MYRQEAKEEYLRALKQGQKEYKELTAAGLDPHPAVLDEILPEGGTETTVDVGLAEIPAERIVGTKSAGRITAFTPTFLPLLDPTTEFAHKWIGLCAAHLSEGIREPIVCFEYLGDFYVQEGNKRVSVLRSFGAPRIQGTVRRLLPERTGEPHIEAYYEFLEFYKGARTYEVRYRRPGDYGKLLSALGKEFGEEWTQWERRTFSAYLQYFREAFYDLGGRDLPLTVEEALLIWTEVYTFRDLGRLSASELKKALGGIWDTVRTQEENVEVKTEQTEGESGGLLSWLTASVPSHLDVAFVSPLDPVISAWIKGHYNGRIQAEQALGDQITTRSYFHADSQEQAEILLDQAVAEGAQVVFTTTPQLSRATLRAAIKYPKVRFLNCSVDVPYSSIRAYYCRIYEAKFITGAIAGAMANHDRIGYIGSNPIFGVPASINAFALGAQMTNPRAKIDLRWSCMAGDPVKDFIDRGYEVISNRDLPIPSSQYLNLCEYGTYFVGADGQLSPLASPVWLWGNFYEKVLRSMLEGTWEQGRDKKALNYWWGMDSGVIDVELAKELPESMHYLANLLKDGLRSGAIDPFARRIVTQDGRLVNDGTRRFTADELLHMDWLCENVTGFIPGFDQLLPIAQPMVRELGIYRHMIPRQKEEDAL